ncbi:hypothetical protein NBRC116588_02530 [Pyruvatibacter sp. HU-CL02332]|uniref:hypothetical protein n=1 Tax=Pyruvatibacter sp. HU-CL02332 TaxID=3127650 RepID=UPI00310864FC
MAVTLLCAGELPDGEGTRLRQRLTVLRAKHAADRTLLAQSDEAGTDVLAQTPLARDVVTAAHAVAGASGSTPLLAPALDAALMDKALSETLEVASPDRFGIAHDKGIAYVLTQGALFPDIPDMPDGMTFELLRSLDAPIALKGERGGVAVVTAPNWSASAEAVGVVARSSSLAQLCASAIEKTVSRPDGELSPEVVWDALGDGARAASALRSAGYLKSAVLTFRGRGRAIGPIDGDRLLRFGVSSWR